MTAKTSIKDDLEIGKHIIIEKKPFWEGACPPARGCPNKFSTPENLWETAEAYFEYCVSNPIYSADVCKTGEAIGQILHVPSDRPFTIEGFCCYAGITNKTFWNYGNNEAYEEYFDVVKAIRGVIRTQKLERAIVGAYNATIVARDLHMKEHSETELTASGGITLNMQYGNKEEDHKE